MPQNFVHVLSRDGRVIAIPFRAAFNGVMGMNQQRMFCQFTAAEILANVRDSFLAAPVTTPRDK